MEKIIGYLLVIFIPVLIVLLNFNLLVVNKSFYKSLYQKAGTYQNFKDQKVVDNATDNLFGYFRGKNKLDQNFFSNQAILHLSDVKSQVRNSFFLFYFSALPVLILSMFLVLKKQIKTLANSFLISSSLTIIFVMAASIGLLNAFDNLFIKFHQALFTNNLWLFPPDDNLIKLFPEQFFVEFANQLAVNILLSSSIIAATSFVLKKLARSKYKILNT